MTTWNCQLARILTQIGQGSLIIMPLVYKTLPKFTPFYYGKLPAELKMWSKLFKIAMNYVQYMSKVYVKFQGHTIKIESCREKSLLVPRHLKRKKQNGDSPRDRTVVKMETFVFWTPETPQNRMICVTKGLHEKTFFGHK